MDAVFICSIGPAHKAQILSAFHAGKPVFCEKPLTPTADESREIIAAEVATGQRLLQLGFMRRFDPGYQALKHTISSGQLGDIMLIHCAHRNPSVPENYTLEMAINDSATHEIDIIRYLLNENIVSVRVDKPRKKPGAPTRICRTRYLLFLKQNPVCALMMSYLLIAITVTTFAAK